VIWPTSASTRARLESPSRACAMLGWTRVGGEPTEIKGVVDDSQAPRASVRIERACNVMRDCDDRVGAGGERHLESRCE
jgi:hypothetical protein